MWTHRVDNSNSVTQAGARAQDEYEDNNKIQLNRRRIQWADFKNRTHPF
jgi:hypothetical protein